MKMREHKLQNVMDSMRYLFNYMHIKPFHLKMIWSLVDEYTWKNIVILSFKMCTLRDKLSFWVTFFPQKSERKNG